VVLLLLWLLLLLIHSGFSLDATSTIRRSRDIVLVASVGNWWHAVGAGVWQSSVMHRLLLLLLMVLLHLLRLLLHGWSGLWVPWHLSDAASGKLVLPFLCFVLVLCTNRSTESNIARSCLEE
jgi:hypothetical protein